MHYSHLVDRLNRYWLHTKIIETITGIWHSNSLQRMNPSLPMRCLERVLLKRSNSMVSLKQSLSFWPAMQLMVRRIPRQDLYTLLPTNPRTTSKLLYVKNLLGWLVAWGEVLVLGGGTYASLLNCWCLWKRNWDYPFFHNVSQWNKFNFCYSILGLFRGCAWKTSIQ